MKKLIIKLLNKIIDSIRKDIDEQEDNTNIEDVLEKYHKYIQSLPYVKYYTEDGKFIKEDKRVILREWVTLKDGRVYEYIGKKSIHGKVRHVVVFVGYYQHFIN